MRSLLLGVAVALLALFSATHELKAQNTSTSISVSRGVKSITHKSGSQRLNIEYDGDIAFTDDDKAIKSISRGGYLLIKKTTFGDRREVLAEPNRDGTINYEYRVGRRRQEWGKEGQEFLANVLIEVIRTTGIGAESRVNRFYEKGGVTAVLEEAGSIRSDFVSKIYVDALLQNHDLSGKELSETAMFISRTMDSDFYIAEIFKDHGDKFLQNKQATEAFLETVGRMDSDHYISTILNELLREDLDAPSIRKVLTVANTMDSDHYKTQILKGVLDRRELEDEVIDMVVLSARDIDSDHYATIVLKDALDRPNLSDQAFTNLMNAVSRIDSDHYLTETFRSMLNQRDVSDKVVEAVMDRIEYMDSDHYRRLILNDLFRNQQISEQYFESLLRTVGDMDSDHYASEILSSLLRDQQLSAELYSTVLERVSEIDSDHYKVRILKDVLRNDQLSKAHLMSLLKAADAIDSDFYKSEILQGACSAVRSINDDEVKDEFRSVARGIDSDTYYGRVARCID